MAQVGCGGGFVPGKTGVMVASMTEIATHPEYDITVGPGGQPPATYIPKLPNKGTYFPNTPMRAGVFFAKLGA